MKEFNKKDAFQLLILKAFQTKLVSPGYEDVLERAVTYASGLPLALEVIGSHLFNKTVEQCNSALDLYERIPNNKIQTILKLSFDALEEEEKSVFLDIACCFKGYQLEKVEKILHAHHGDNMKHPISVLVEKSLIKISELGNVMLHDLIEDMGKEIVRQDSPKDPGKRSRLWCPKDIVEVLEDNTGTEKVEIIRLDFEFESEITVNWDGQAFKKMEYLRTLIIKGGKFSESSKYLPNSLRVLELMQLPLWPLPPEFYPKKLVICILSYDFISSGWGNFYMKRFTNMKALDFHDNSVLTRIPDISGLLNLEEFSVQNCRNLIAVDDSVGFLGKLKILRISSCTKLKSIPRLNLGSLENLNLDNCHNLESFPLVEDGLLNKLKILRISYCTKLKRIPPLNLGSLEKLNLERCPNLESFPPVEDGLLNKLKILRISNCTKLKSIPPLKLASLEELHLEYCDSFENLLALMDVSLDKLKFLRVRFCKMLNNFAPLKLASLEDLCLEFCISLKSFPPMLDGSLGKLKILSFVGCENLTSIGPLSLPSLEELDLSFCENLESFSPVVEKLKIFRAKSCNKLMNIPSINLASLQELDLLECGSLESLPLVLDGLLEKFNVFSIEGCFKFESIPLRMLALSKQFQLSCCGRYVSFQELLLERQNIAKGFLCNCRIPHKPGNGIIIMLSEVSPMQSVPVELLCLCKHSLSDESLEISLKWFSNIKELYLSENDLTILPECIENFSLLWKLVLDNCEKLREIKGIPPSLKSLSAHNCIALTRSCKSNLLKQELHEAGNTFFCLPRAKIPDWFNYQWMAGSSITFWFRKKFPCIALCVLSPLIWNHPTNTWNHLTNTVKVIINGDTFLYRDDRNNFIPAKTYHLLLFHMQMEKFNDNLDKALLENKWNHVKVYFEFDFHQSGLHVLNEKISMEDVRFTNPENDIITELIGESMDDID